MIDVGAHGLGAVFMAFALGAVIGAGLGWVFAPSEAPSRGEDRPAVHATGVGAGVVPRTVELNITSVPSGASLYVDGVYVGRTPMRRARWVIPDASATPVLELRRPGFETARVTLDAEVRADVRVELEARRAAVKGRAGLRVD